jgi:SAM-dependent methyltransferase
MSDHPKQSLFDRYATSYDSELDAALSVSGETSAFFATGRIRWLAQRLAQRGTAIRTLMDFGCGTGSSAQRLLEVLRADSVIGVDSSMGLLETARRMHQSKRIRFCAPGLYTAESQLDLAYCNGVFHHIPDVERVDAMRYIHRALRPGGIFSFWENNPWNPGTRYIMRRTEFDRDARPLSHVAARRLLRASGFQPLETHFLFVFPHLFRVFRPLERFVSGVPLGGQYHILCMKPG